MPVWRQAKCTHQIKKRSSSIVKASNSKKYQRAYPSSRIQLGRRGHMPGPPAFAVMSLSCFLADLADQHTRRMCMEQNQVKLKLAEFCAKLLDLAAACVTSHACS
jgi:hypothetical protein